MSDTSTEQPAQARFWGTLMQAWFRTDIDLESWMPTQLEIVGDPHRAFIKVYDLKTRKVNDPQRRPVYSQYKQSCVSILARPVGTELEPRQHNFIMWEHRSWALGTGGLSWPKRKADIEMTAIWPFEHEYRDTEAPLDYVVDISEYHHRLLKFDGVLDGEKKIDLPPLNGFYIPDGTQPAVYMLPFLDWAYGEPQWGGEATLEFGHAGTEIAPPTVLTDAKGRQLGRLGVGDLGVVDVEGFAVHDVMFFRQFDQIQRVPLS